MTPLRQFHLFSRWSCGRVAMILALALMVCCWLEISRSAAHWFWRIPGARVTSGPRLRTDMRLYRSSTGSYLVNVPTPKSQAPYASDYSLETGVLYWTGGADVVTPLFVYTSAPPSEYYEVNDLKFGVNPRTVVKSRYLAFNPLSGPGLEVRW